jgi:6-phosphogluconolactonase (cycloisomerase 2 family)
MRSIMAGAIFILLLGGMWPPLEAQSTQPTFLFLLEGRGVTTGTIHVFSLNATTGILTEVPGSPFNAGLIPQLLAVDPTGRFLYVANLQSQDITALSIDPLSGALTALPGSPFPIGGQPVAMAIDPTGRFLYISAATAQGPSLFEFTIDAAAGVLTAAPGSPQSGLFATSIVFSPLGNYAYLSTGSPDPGTSNPILVCAINFATGMLTPVSAGQPSAGGSNAIAISPNGNSLYSIDAVTNDLDAFSVSAGGLSLAEIAGSPLLVPNSPFSLVVHPTGKFVYIVNENQSYQTNLTPSQYNGSISAFSVAPASGALAPVPGSPFAAGINPLSIVIEPAGRFAYTTSTTYTSGFTGFAQIESFSIDPSTGIPAPLSGSPWTDSVQSNGSRLAISHGALLATNPAPMISSLSPPSTTATGAAFTLQVNGANFVPGSAVYFGGQQRITTFVSSTQLNAAILASDVDNGGTAVIFVFNPLPGGGASTSVEFPVFNPSPIISSLSPSSVAAGVSGFSFAVVGSNFVTSSVINFNGSPLQTSYAGPTVVTTAIPVALITTQGTASITVTNPPNGLPGGGTSNAVTMTILPPNTTPVVTSISPTSATAGAPAFTLAVNGTGFVQGSQVTFNLNNVATTFVNSSQLTAAIPASAIAVAGNPYVIVNNPDGFASAQINFAVSNPQPVAGSINPPSLPVGSNALTLNVVGSGFEPGSVVLVSGSPRATTFESSTLLQAALLPGDLAQGGTLLVTVMNPAPGGGTTAALSLKVTDYSLVPPSSIPPIAAGQTASIPLTVSPMDGPFSNLVTLSVSQLPADTTAAFQPSATVTPGAAPQTVTLLISTSPHTALAAVRFPRGKSPALPMPFVLGMVTALAVLCRRASRETLQRVDPRLSLVLLLWTAVAMIGCGAVGYGSSPQLNPATGTPAGNYTITVTAATSGGVSRSANITLTVM